MNGVHEEGMIPLRRSMELNIGALCAAGCRKKEEKGDHAGFKQLLELIERRYGGSVDELTRQRQRLQVVGD